ncbi:MAG TPA: hypothetical protein VMZ03_02640, partial [Chitinophagaceae bacterium]|nr:hypothetical protein [Chitinophagaceae bacterium]
MARQTGSFIKATIGNVIYYEHRGIPVMRSKPTQVRQSKASKKSAQEFGRAIIYSRKIRSSLRDLLVPGDRSVMYRLNNAFLQWLKDSRADKKLLAEYITELRSFELNESSRLTSCLRFKPEAEIYQTGKIFVVIPALTAAKDISAPANTRRVRLTIICARCTTLDKPVQVQVNPEDHQTVMEMDYNDTRHPAQRVEISFKTTRGDIVLVAIGLSYFVMKQKNLIRVTDPKWLPAV